MHEHEPMYVSIDGFAARTSLSSRAVWQLIKAGNIPALKIGKRRLIPLAEALEALKQCDRLVTESSVGEVTRDA